MKFEATVRSHSTKLGLSGRIHSKELAPFIDKKVRVTIEEIDVEEKAQAQEKE